MSEYLQLAAQAWCQPTTSNKLMDQELAEAFSKILESELSSEKAKVKELEKALEWLAIADIWCLEKKYSGDNWGVYNTETNLIGTGSTPIEAIQNAMSKDKSD